MVLISDENENYNGNNSVAAITADYILRFAEAVRFAWRLRG